MFDMKKDWSRYFIDRFMWLIIILVIGFFAMFANNFLTPLNMVNVMLHASVLGLMLIGQAVCLISGNFDLSAEGSVAFLTVLAAWLMGTSGKGVADSFASGSGWGVNPILTIAIIISAGAFIGWLNGTMITRLKMNNFIVTLAMQLTLKGLSLTISKGKNISGLPDAFRWLGTGKLGPLPVQVIVTVLAVIAFNFYLNNSRFGRELYATGGNRFAALASGFKPDRTIVRSYMISGVMAAIAAWMLLGRIGESTLFLGNGFTLETVAAAVIGGIALSGGSGKIIGAFAGVMLLSVVDNGLNLMSMNPNAMRLVRGLILLLALLVDAQKHRYKPKISKTRNSNTTQSSTVVPTETTK